MGSSILVLTINEWLWFATGFDTEKRMGISFLNGSYSKKLEAKTAKLRQSVLERVADGVTTTSTAGYDNDGSCGPELIDNGVSLGLELAELRRDGFPGTIFWWSDEVTAYYVVATDEDQALETVTELIKAAEQHFKDHPEDDYEDDDSYSGDDGEWSDG